MKKILFRADANPAIGTGDLVSLINLSKEFSKQGFECHFCFKNSPAALKLSLKHDLKNILIIEPEKSISEESNSIYSYCSEKRINDVFFEITERKLTDYKLEPQYRFSCVNFDGVIPEGMFLVVNWNVEAVKQYDAEKNPETIFLLGPEYVILPSNFDSEKIKNRTYKAPVKNVLIAMGGADELDYTGKVVSSLIGTGNDFDLKIIVGAGYTKCEQLQATLCAGGIKYEIKSNIDDMFEQYMAADIGIGAGGLTSSELVASKTPALLIALYEHQVERCKHYEALGLAKYLGFRDKGLSALSEVFSAKDFANIKSPHANFSFEGNFRIVEVFLK